MKACPRSCYLWCWVYGFGRSHRSVWCAPSEDDGLPLALLAELGMAPEAT